MDQSLLTILHFNDAYNIEPNDDGSNGVVNFEACLTKARKKHPNNILLHSGDALSPALLNFDDSFPKGTYMIKSLNMLNITAACMGNHEFDLKDDDNDGEPDTITRFKESNFPWLMGNILVKST